MAGFSCVLGNRGLWITAGAFQSALQQWEGRNQSLFLSNKSFLEIVLSGVVLKMAVDCLACSISDVCLVLFRTNALFWYLCCRVANCAVLTEKEDT